jgi:hypothetical protein
MLLIFCYFHVLLRVLMLNILSKVHCQCVQILHFRVLRSLRNWEIVHGGAGQREATIGFFPGHQCLIQWDISGQSQSSIAVINWSSYSHG